MVIIIFYFIIDFNFYNPFSALRERTQVAGLPSPPLGGAIHVQVFAKASPCNFANAGAAQPGAAAFGVRHRKKHNLLEMKE